MIPLRRLTNAAWEKAAVMAGVLLVLIPMNPRIMRMPLRDSGVFLYAGWRILNGEIPYLHFWDHKPPVIFYINALGLALTGGSRWGVWMLEVISLSLAAWIGFLLIRKHFGIASVILGLLLFLSGVVLSLEGGNYTEEFALPMQFAVLWLAWNADNNRFDNWRGFVIGVLVALAFFTKQTTIGVGLGTALYLLIQRFSVRQFRQLLAEGLVVLGGFVAVASTILLFFAAHSALDELIDAAFVYNFVYSGQGIGEFRPPLLFMANFLLPLGLAGCGLCILRWKSAPALIKIALLSLPVEFALAGLSNYIFGHYFLTGLPVLTLLAAYTIQLILGLFKNKALQIGITAVAVLVLILSQFTAYQDMAKIYAKQHPALEMSAAKRVKSDGYFLVWGSETAFNFMTHHAAPSRFNYLYPLYQTQYVNEGLVLEFLDDLLARRPIILNSNNPLMPLFVFPVNSPAIESRLEILKFHYRLRHEYKSGWAVYEYDE